MKGRFGDELKRLRLERGLSQGDAAHHASISRTQWHQIENNYVDPRLSTVIRLLEAVGANLIIEKQESAS